MHASVLPALLPSIVVVVRSPDGLPVANALAVKEEPRGTAGSDHGEEEMEVDSTEEEAPRVPAAPAAAVVPKVNTMAGSFNTLSSLSSLRPGNTHTHAHHAHTHTKYTRYVDPSHIG